MTLAHVAFTMGGMSAHTAKENTMAKNTTTSTTGKAKGRVPMSPAQRKKRDAELAKQRSETMAQSASTRVARRYARAAVYPSALKRFWALTKDGEPYRYGEVGIALSTSAAVTKNLPSDGGNVLTPGDWRNLGLRCHRQFCLQGIAHRVPKSQPHTFTMVVPSGQSPVLTPLARQRRSDVGRGSTSRKTSGRPTTAAAKAKAAKARAARKRSQEAG